MTDPQDSKTKALVTAERLFRAQGYAATGLAQIIAESGSPKGSFYFLFPSGKSELARQVIERYAASAESMIRHIGSISGSDANVFIDKLCRAFAREMMAGDYRLGCAVQTLASEKALDDDSLADAIKRALASWHKALEDQFFACSLDKETSASLATALLAALEGARTLARVQRSTVAFDAIRSIFGVRASDLSREQSSSDPSAAES